VRSDLTLLAFDDEFGLHERSAELKLPLLGALSPKIFFSFSCVGFDVFIVLFKQTTKLIFIANLLSVTEKLLCVVFVCGKVHLA